MLNRCTWAKDSLSIEYHDKEWCKPEHNDRKLFEFLILEGAQAGLTWITILKRRSGYRKAFSDFDPVKVSKYTQKHVDRLMQDKNIIRNRLKINSAINNARGFLKIQKEFGSFDKYIWDFVSQKPLLNNFKKMTDLPASSSISEKISKDLKSRGFNFVGPTICYAFMQAIGMTNDHLITCYLYRK